MKTLLTLIITLFIATGAFAQDYVLRVMLNKGENQYGNDGDWQKLVTGTKLQNDQSVKVGDDSYVAFVHSSGSTLELKEAGVYKVSELDQKVSSGQSSLLQKYTNYIMDNIADENHHRLSATGAVDRAIYNIIVYLPKFSEYLEKEQIFDWEDIEGISGFEVILKDKFDDEIMKKEVKESEVMFDFSDPKLKNEELIVAYINVLDEESVDNLGFGLKPVKDEELIRIKTEVEELKNQIEMDSPLSHLVLAAYFEENSLYSDAITHFKKAIEMAPEVSDYKKLYEDFLIRSDLKDKTN